jgi:propanol-preferring alcohol dehydrogenase
MKAALLYKLGEPLVVEDVPIPRIGPDEALVETRTCGICRTDLHIQEGLAYVPRLPHVPGHEPAGVVVEIGSGVRELAVGQRVVPHLFINSGECIYTRAGQHAQATNLTGIFGVTLPGGFAEYFKAPARNLLLLPETVPFDSGGLTSCAVITAVHAYRKSGLQAGDTAVVLGAGGIGLLLIQILRASRVRAIAVDRSEPSLNMAAREGAELSLLIGAADTAQRIRQSCNERGGVDCVFELVGATATMREAAAYVCRGGRIVVIGEAPDYPEINTIQIAQQEIQIIGSRNGGLDDARDALRMLATGVVRPCIAARFPLHQINDALQFARSGLAPGRVIVTLRE